MPVIGKYSLKGRKYINWVFIEIGSKKSWGRWTIVKLHSKKMISEPLIGIEPAIFWRPVKRSNRWATKTQMASYGATLTYMRNLSGSYYILIMIDVVSASTDERKVVASIPVRGSEIVFLSIKLDNRSSISRYMQSLTFPKSETASKKSS